MRVSVLRPATGVGRRHKVLVFRPEQLRHLNLPAPQMCSGGCSTEKNNLCGNHGAVGRFYHSAGGLKVFTFQEERLGRLVCIGLKRLQLYWQRRRNDTTLKPGTGQLLPLFTRINSVKLKFKRGIISSVQISVQNYKIN